LGNCPPAAPSGAAALYTNISSNKAMLTRYEVRYQTPYNACEWRSQWFNTLAEAERMVAFYLSCGSKSYIA